MNFGSSNRHKSKVVGKENINNAAYTNRLSMYKTPPNPTEEMSLEEFERFAIDRLKLLREVENINIRFKREEEDYDKKMRKSLKELMPKYFEVNINTSQVTLRKEKEEKKLCFQEEKNSEMRKDHLSHFILRLAFARSEDLRRWYLQQEMDLFRYRFQEENNQIEEFLKENNLAFHQIDAETKELIKTQLKDCMFDVELTTIEGMQFYEVPFTDVLDLVKNRKVFLKKGKAFVPRSELISIVSGIYRAHLSQALAIAAKKLPYLEEDTRLLPMLKNLSNTYVGDSFTTKKTSDGEKLVLGEIDQASVTSFPICMRNLHEGIRKEHHLKHFGRLQYGLFLKSTGLTLEESLQFWRQEFTKNMDIEKFEKQYAYNVRHSYGKEGKRADYTPYSCLKIITANQPGPGDYHGCPFKHSDADVLQRRLQTYKVPSGAIHEIVDLVKRQHFQIACAKYFEVTHKLQPGTMSINHPNQYFIDSRRIFNGGAKPSGHVPVKTEPDEKPSNDTSITKPDVELSKNDDVEMFDLADDIPML